MGNPTQAPAPPSYRNEADADAVSMHTTRGDYEYDDAPDLPSYSDSEAAEASSSQSSSGDASASRPVASVDPYPRVQPVSNWRHTSSGKVQNKNETVIRMDARLNDADQLQDYVEKYLTTIPPNPLVRIVGTHQETHYNAKNKKDEKQTVTDFDFSFSLQSYLKRDPEFWVTLLADNGDRVHRGSFRKTRAKSYMRDIESAESGCLTLQDWCRDYSNSKFALKVFRVNREITGLGTDYLRPAIERLVRSTHYHAHVDISFPIEEKTVDIYSPHWVNKARLSWVRWFFYLTFLWLITWPILFFTTKIWAVYTVRWTWSRCYKDEERAAHLFCLRLHKREAMGGHAQESHHEPRAGEVSRRCDGLSHGCPGRHGTAWCEREAVKYGR